MIDFKLHFISLGGITNVTKNMYVYELYQDKTLKDILIIDCGIGFPQENELGVDFIIPDISYLTEEIYDPPSQKMLRRASRIRAIILTHGHEDHIGALAYHYRNLGSPPIYSGKLTAAFVENKFREFNQKISVNKATGNLSKDYQFGNFKVKFITVPHSIPDTMHILISTPLGNFYHGTDFKFDLTPPYGPPPDFFEITKAGKERILCLMSDCLGAEREGLTLSESAVGQTFEDEMRKTKGKFIMTTFSSNISRIRQCVEAAIKFNRKTVFLGMSMKENTKLSQEIGYLPIPSSLMAKEEEVMKLQPNKICLIVAGSQGQYDSALSKLAHKQNKNIRIKPGDKVIFSSDPIPGNENEIYTLIEELTLQGAEVIYSDIQDQLHASGHANKEDLKFLMRFTHPSYFIPIGGTVRHQRQYQKIVGELGYKKDSVFLLNEGETVWFANGSAYKGDKIETKNIYVDAYGVGDVGNIILRDRKTLSSEGMVVAVLIIDNQKRLLVKPKILSRGFVFEKNEDQLFERATILIEKTFKQKKVGFGDIISVKRETISLLEDYFRKEKGRRPLILVEAVEI